MPFILFDESTLFAVNSIICLTGTVVFYFNWQGNRRQAGLFQFFLAFALVFVGSTLVIFNSVHIVFVTLTYIGLFSGLTLGIQGFMHFWSIRRAKLVPALWGLTLLAISTTTYFTLFEDNYRERVITASLLTCAIYATYLYLIFHWYRRKRPPQSFDAPTYGIRLIAASTVLGILPQLVRLSQVVVMNVPVDDPSFVSLSATMLFFDTWRSLFLIMGVVMMTSELHQVTLLKMAMRDPLTGLLNRRAFERLLAKIQKRSRTRSRSVALLMLDLDHFKRINDTYGHEAGDVVLKQFAEQLDQVYRQQDICCRYGGEEFLLLLIDVTEQKALEIAQRTRMLLHEHVPQYNDTAIPLTVSIGVAVTTLEDFELGAVARKADKALYRAKEQGRDRVVLANELD